MEDARVWEFEESLWTADAEHYRESIDEACLMVLPQPPYVYTGEQAIAAVQETPRWSTVKLSEQQVSRPEEGMIVVAYRAKASRDEEGYEAYCTSVYRRIAHDDWKVVQHQQLPPITLSSGEG